MLVSHEPGGPGRSFGLTVALGQRARVVPRDRLLRRGSHSPSFTAAPPAATTGCTAGDLRSALGDCQRELIFKRQIRREISGMFRTGRCWSALPFISYLIRSGIPALRADRPGGPTVRLSRPRENRFTTACCGSSGCHLRFHTCLSAVGEHVASYPCNCRSLWSNGEMLSILRMLATAQPYQHED